MSEIKSPLLASTAALFSMLLTPFVAKAAGGPAEAVRVATDRTDRAIATVRKTGDLASVISDLESSRLMLENAQKELTDAGKNADAAYAMTRAADCLRIQSKWTESQSNYEKAIEQARRAGSVEFEAKAWLGLERAARIGLHDHKGAAEAISQAMRLIEERNLPRTLLIDVLGEKAELELSDGQTAEALTTIQLAVKGAEEIGDRDRRWQSLLSRSSIHHWAATALGESYNGMPYMTANQCTACEAVAHQVLDTIQQGIQDSERAGEISGQLGHAYISKSITSQLPSLKSMAEVFENGVTLRKQACLRNQASGAEPTQELGSRPNVAPTILAGKPIPARLLSTPVPILDPVALRKYIESVRSELYKERPLTAPSWRKRFTEGLMFEAERKVNEALSAYRDAAELIGDERKTVPNELLRSGFTAEKTDLYDRLILNLLDREEFDEAFHWIERSRGREMADMVASADLTPPTPKERELYARWIAARALISASEGSRAGGVQAQMRVIAQIESEAPQLFDLIEPRPVVLGDLRRAMQEAPFDLIYYMLSNGRIVLWHIGPQRIEVEAYVAQEAELRRLFAKIMRGLTGPSEFPWEAAESLYAYLAQPALRLMETKHLVIVAPPAMQGFPLQVLVNPLTRRYSDDEVALSYTPSASLVVRLRPALKLAGAKVLTAIGPGLHFGEKDAANIAGLYPRTKILRDGSATFSAVAREVVGRTVVHIAAHGEYNETSSMLSTVRLSPEHGQSGYTTAAQMLTLPLRGVELFTLASCSAAKVSVDSSNEIFGFARSLFYAGAQSAILPLWRVSDEAAVFWFQSFYSEARTNPLPEAARRANRATREHPVFGSEPKDWAAYMVFGR